MPALEVVPQHVELVAARQHDNRQLQHRDLHHALRDLVRLPEDLGVGGRLLGLDLDEGLQVLDYALGAQVGLGEVLLLEQPAGNFDLGLADCEGVDRGVLHVGDAVVAVGLGPYAEVVDDA